MLIGRTEEIAKLNTQLDQVREGMSGAVMLWGEAGIGKMALLNATVESAQDLSVHRVRDEVGLWGPASTSAPLPPLVATPPRALA